MAGPTVQRWASLRGIAQGVLVVEHGISCGLGLVLGLCKNLILTGFIRVYRCITRTRKHI